MARKKQNKVPFATFQKQIAKDKPAPLYILNGGEEQLRIEAEAAIAARVLGADAQPDGMTYVALHGPANRNELGATPVSLLLDEAQAAPMLAERKLVVARDADAWVANRADALARHIEHPPSFSVLVLHVTKLDARTKFAKQAGNIGVIVECRPLYESRFGEDRASASSELGRWVRDRGRDKGLALQNEQVVDLIEMLGPSLAAQESGLEKLALFLGAKADGRPTPVTDEAMENALAQSRADKVFALSDAVAAADLPRSLELATRMFASGLVLDDKIERRAQTIALLAIAALGRDVERRLLLKTELERGTRQAEALKTAGVPHFRSEQAVRAAGRLTLDGLQQQLEAVFEADLDLKTSAGDPQALLENLLIRLHLASDRNKLAAARRR